MFRSDIPTDEELATIRENFEGDETIQWLCNAVSEMKRQLDPEERPTTPSPFLEEVPTPRSTMVGVAPPPPIMTMEQYRCAACLHEFKPTILPTFCPSCGSEDTFPVNDSKWPCGDCGKTREGFDPCTCSREPDERIDRV